MEQKKKVMVGKKERNSKGLRRGRGCEKVVKRCNVAVGRFDVLASDRWERIRHQPGEITEERNDGRWCLEEVPKEQ
jgi:hypothetical protein